MSEEETIPEWVRAVLESIDSRLTFKSFGFMEPYHYSKDENDYDLPFLEMAPIKIKHGQTDDEFYDGIENFDLLDIQKDFEELESMTFGVEHDGHPCFTFEGTIKGVQIVLKIYTEPFDDTKAAILDHGVLHLPERD